MAPPIQLLPRQNFGDPFPSQNRGLHPGAIFGIVASVIIILAITAYCVMFRVWKKIMTNREYGVLPTLRIAADRRSGAPPPVGTPYGGAHDPAAPPPPYGHGEVVSMETRYPPAVAHDVPAAYGYGNKPLDSYNEGGYENRALFGSSAESGGMNHTSGNGGGATSGGHAGTTS